MKIIKRNGTEVIFDISKIIVAITKANNSVPEKVRLSSDAIKEIAHTVATACENVPRALGVEEIQDLVENEIMDRHAHEVARSYITYRYNRKLM